MDKNIIIVSDLHLTPEFNQKKYIYLKNLFQKADQIIVNGDFWSYYLCDFDDFLKSDWQKLFPLMLEKSCIYINGNHDRKEWCGDNARLFSIENHERYSFEHNNNKFHIQHGHLISKMSVENKKIIQYIKKHNLDKYNNLMHDKVINIFGDKIYRTPGKILNKKQKKFNRKNIPEKEYLICGHSHSPEESLEKKYINTGFINYSYSSYLQINGHVSLIKERY